MRYRQIHLDFHTSPVIDDVGKDFSVEDFVSTLKNSHVNSINIFSKCHHGMCYYPTKVGIMHPSLKFDLLGTMISALHSENIQCPIYFPLGWEEDAANHTDWLEIGKDGIPGHKHPDDASNNSWRKLCLNNSAYKEYIKAQLHEIITNYDVDGFWFDIIFQQNCICPTCSDEMREMGLDPSLDKDILIHDEYALSKLQSELNEYVWSLNPNISTFYNGSWDPDGKYNGYTRSDRCALQSHIEIESLPSGKWGYNHFPYFVNYYNSTNTDLIGMTGKFHLSWGDHGSLKNIYALEYECFRMIANGCACSIGDQLHPRGRMNKAAYKLIGEIYQEIEKVENLIPGTKKVSDIGVIVSSDFFDHDSRSDTGAMRMLMELHYTFDFIPSDEDLSRYKLIILPDTVSIDEVLSNKLKNYIEIGGKVLSTYRSTDSDSLGIQYISENDYCPSYMVIHDGFAGIDSNEYVCYERGAYVKSDLPVISYIGDPYFNRTASCFSSHMHFPYNKSSEFPAILSNGNVAYCAFPIFRDYIINGNKVYRDVISGLLNMLLERPCITTDAPTCCEVSVRESDRFISVHLISYVPERRTETIDIVDTRLPLFNIKISVKFEGTASKVFCVRSRDLLVFTRSDGYIRTVIPMIDGYEILVIEK